MIGTTGAAGMAAGRAAAAGLGLLAAIALGGGALAQDGPAQVLVEHAELTEITETTPIHAELVATTESEVATRTAGVVSEVLFRVGDRVELGALLVRLDRDLIDIRKRTAEAALETARAGVAVAEAKLRLAQQAFERQRRLQGSSAFSRGQFEDLEESAAQARSELARSQAQMAEAEAAVAAAEYDERHAEIRAPFAGTVVERAAQPGSYIALGQPVATLLDTAALEIEASLPARLTAGVRPGQTIAVEIGGGREVAATVRTLLPVEDRTTRTRPVRLETDLAAFADAERAAGRSLILHVPVSAPREALTVPKDALVQARGGWQVFTVVDETATPVRVDVADPVANRVEVVSGLKPGDVVVVRGNERLRPGQPVATRPAQAPSDGEGSEDDASATALTAASRG